MNGMTQRAAWPFNHPNPNPNPTNRSPKTAILSEHLCLNGTITMALRIALESEPLLCILR